MSNKQTGLIVPVSLKTVANAFHHDGQGFGIDRIMPPVQIRVLVHGGTQFTTMRLDRINRQTFEQAEIALDQARIRDWVKP